VSISLMGQYQRYQFERSHVSELSLPLSIGIPLGRDWYWGLSTSAAGVASGLLTDVKGVSDVNTTVTYSRTLGEGSLVVSLAGTLPSGKQELTLPEFSTMVLLSQAYYGFRVPAFGQGFSLTPNISWAQPIGTNLVLGLGISYRLNGRYTPVYKMEDQYNPGNHIMLAAGLDVRLNTAASLSGDLKYTRYKTDKLGSEAWYTAGSRVSANAQFRRYFGSDELRIVAMYRSHAEGQNQVASALFADQNVRALPNHAGVSVRFSKQLQDRTIIGILCAVRYYGKNDSGISVNGERRRFGVQRLADYGVFSEITAFESLAVLLNVSGTAGTFSGVSGGIGLRVRI
jgi:hypothetical protein